MFAFVACDAYGILVLADIEVLIVFYSDVFIGNDYAIGIYVNMVFTVLYVDG